MEDAGSTDGPTRTEIFIGWLLEAMLADAPPERQKAFAWNLCTTLKDAKAKGEATTQAEAGAITLAQAFLDSMRSPHSS